mmetsp:Transcript_12500/g.20968  ORF Transcript_12500/g.20968 Transcript_12500/m.20968 type:complete len:99 (-) Transcript_12500:1076-1372(-)
MRAEREVAQRCADGAAEPGVYIAVDCRVVGLTQHKHKWLDTTTFQNCKCAALEHTNIAKRTSTARSCTEPPIVTCLVNGRGESRGVPLEQVYDEWNET